MIEKDETMLEYLKSLDLHEHSYTLPISGDEVTLFAWSFYSIRYYHNDERIELWDDGQNKGVSLIRMSNDRIGMLIVTLGGSIPYSPQFLNVTSEMTEMQLSILKRYADE